MLHDLFLDFLMTENEGAVLVDSGECLDVPAKDIAHVASSLAASILRKVSFEALPSHCPPSPRLACPSQSLPSDSVISETQSEATEENPSSEAVVSSIESSQVQLQQDNDPFRNQAELPHVSPTIFVYPNSASEISDAFQSRFRQVINLFRLNTEQHPRLKFHLEYIDYGLRMCGPSIDEAHPSILVFCRPSEFDSLRSLLNSKHLKIQYCRRKSTPKYSWKSWGKKPSQMTADSYKPLFNLYFWRAPRPRNLYCMNAVSVAINTTKYEPPPLTTVGTTITVPDEQHLFSTSTIGCILQVDSHLYGLTAAHVLRCAKVAPNDEVRHTPHEPWSNPAAFKCQTDPLYDGSSMASDEEAFEPEDTPQSSFYDSVADDMPDDDDFVEDVEYGSVPDDDQAQERWQDSGVSLAAPVANLSPVVLDQEQLHRIALFPSSNCSATAGVPDNDWALVALDSKDQPLPNAFFDTNTTSQPTFISTVAQSLPEEETPVLIVPSRRRVLKGFLQPTPCILGGVTRHEQAEYWSVILSNGEDLINGDSGSLVVDANNSAVVYGHVIGSNPLGDVYVSPLMTTMSQIMGLLSTSHVALPEPLPLLTGLTSYHLRNNHDFAFELLKYLDNLIQTMQQAQDWSSLQSWGLCYQRDEFLEAVRKSLQVARVPERVHMLQKFSPDHSEKLLGLEIRISNDFESTSLLTAPGSGIPVTSGQEDMVPEAELVTLRKSSSESRIPSHGSDSDTTTQPKTSEDEMNGGEEMTTEDIKHLRYYLQDKSYLAEQPQQIDVSNQGPSEEEGTTTEYPSSASQQDVKGKSRRLSIEEDNSYSEIFTGPPIHPPSYESVMGTGVVEQKRALTPDLATEALSSEKLPEYSTGVNLEGFFTMKLEIENTTKRAEVRQWRMVYVELRGTAFNIYDVKKHWSWARPKSATSELLTDNPPWVTPRKLEKSYSLQHADAGIAADYKKRRFVIRIRAETDQFLLSCVELETFITWLNCLFAAIDIALPLDDRDFPRDQSLTRMERMYWSRGQSPSGADYRRLLGDQQVLEETESGSITPSGPSDLVSQGDIAGYGPSTRRDAVMPRLSTTSQQNESVDPETGKWSPRHGWSVGHDFLYAKLCFSILLYKSPRKSNYVISEGKQWFVDWATGRMVRVLPPTYVELESFGPWQIVKTESRRI